MKARQTGRHQSAAICLVGLYVATATAGPPDINGRLSEYCGLTVLEVWGTPEEAGYAHGYLLGDRLATLFDQAVLDPAMGTPPEAYESMILPAVERIFVWQPRHVREIEAVLRGAQARLGPDGFQSAILGRAIELGDLKLVNTMADWRGVLCSSFSAWGKRTVNGQTITARNLDYDSTPAMRRGQVVLVYRGDGRTRPWTGVTWPGLIGVYTAMNADGVTIAMHDASGLPMRGVSGYSPRSMVLREALEAAGAETWLADVQRVLRQRRALVGNNVMVSGPHRAGQPAAAVFEYDGNTQDQGLTVRLPDTGAASLPEAICCTNHMRGRKPPRECGRYATLVQGLSVAADERERLDPRKALDLIHRARRPDTLHSVVFSPHTRMMLVEIKAIQPEPVELRMAEWLKRQTNAGVEQRPEREAGS